MKSKLLIVDDDLEILLSLKEALLHQKDLVVSTATDGLAALEQLRAETFSLVVTDIRMPRMDGLSLLAHIKEEFPHIPVIVMTGYSSDAREKLAWETGCAAYYKKPIEISTVVNNIISEIQLQSDSGKLQNITISMFVQLIQMEQKTCTIRVTDSSTGKHGVLFFSEGELLEAITPGARGFPAALSIFLWEQVSVGIQNSCPLQKKHIQESLPFVLLEAMRQKDESKTAQPSKPSNPKAAKHQNPAAASRHEVLTQAIDREIGNSMIQNVLVDNSWQGFVSEIKKIGAAFNAGKTEMVYVSRGETKDHILFPDDDITVLAVRPNCPRDKIIQIIRKHL